jgi:hypothetical protein
MFGSASSVLSRPSQQEVIRLHRELQIWMMHTRYQLQANDNQPVWRMHNTSLTFGTGAGVGAYVMLGKYVPKLKFPVNIIPPLVLWYFTYRASQVQQLPQLYTSILSLPTPLGGKGREVLTALRSGGRLPSQDFANQKPPSAGQREAAEPAESAAHAAHGDDTSASQIIEPSNTLPKPTQKDSSSVYNPMPLRASSTPEPDPAPIADPWNLDSGLGGTPPGGAAPSWEGDAWPLEQNQAAAKPRATWEQIRARQAAAAERPTS